MGRPIKKTFFGNLNTPNFGSVPLGSGVGGQGVASASVTASNTGTGYSQGATLSFSAPQLAGGTTATGTPVVTAAGGISSVTVTSAGSGYVTTVTMTVNTASSVSVNATGTSATNVIYPTSTVGIYAGMRVTGANISASTTYVTSVAAGAVTLGFNNTSTVSNIVLFTDVGTGFASTNTVVLTSTVTSAISIISWIPSAAQSRANGDIIKQESSRRYLVQNSDGIGQCSLTTGTLTSGTMHIIGSDYSGATYYVTKLTARKAVLYPRSGTGYYTYGDVAPWNITGATGTNTGTAIIGLTYP